MGKSQNYKKQMTQIVRMTSKIADSSYYIAAMFGSLSWEGESLSSEPAHQYQGASCQRSLS